MQLLYWFKMSHSEDFKFTVISITQFKILKKN